MSQLHKQCKWIVNTTNSEFVSYVSRIAGLSHACAQVLINRGIKTPEQINFFKGAATSSLSDPFAIEGISSSVQRIKRAIKDKDKILVSGDYDADGLTATAIMLEGLKRMGAEASYFIPHRLRDGYGFGESSVSAAVSCGAKLIITVDSGITSFDALRGASRLGIDVIVTDHHEPMRNDKGLALLPEAYSIVNPKLMTEGAGLYNLQELAGAGVALKLVHALTEDEDFVNSLLDLVAIGTSADVVSVLGENRLLLNRGLRLIGNGNRPGIKALKDAAGINNGSFRNSMVYYSVNPRINAPGRIDDSRDVIRLLTTPSAHEASEIARWMCEMNAKRQRIEEKVFREALEQAEGLTVKDGAIVVASEGWHLGVVGIVASRLVEHFGIPACVFVLEGDIAKGSARGNGNFDLLEALKECEPLLERFGGHKQAAGLSLRADRLDAFRECINAAALKICEQTTPALSIDALVGLSDITHELVQEIESLEPFGHCNKEPLFGSRMLEVVDSRIVGNNHLRMNVRQKGRVVNCIAFDMGHMREYLSSGYIDALYLPTANKQYNSIQLQIKAFRSASEA